MHRLPTQAQASETPVQSGQPPRAPGGPADLGAIVGELRRHAVWLRGEAASELGRAARGGCADRMRRHDAQATACALYADEVEASIARLERVLFAAPALVERLTHDVMQTLGGAR